MCLHFCASAARLCEQAMLGSDGNKRCQQTIKRQNPQDSHPNAQTVSANRGTNKRCEKLFSVGQYLFSNQGRVTEASVPKFVPFKYLFHKGLMETNDPVEGKHCGCLAYGNSLSIS